MSYQSEAELEEHLIQKLISQGYERVILPDYDNIIVVVMTTTKMMIKGGIKRWQYFHLH